MVIDANHQFIPTSGSFAFREPKDQYKLVCRYTLDMTPGIKAENVHSGFGDYFLTQEDVQKYFPNIKFLLDTCHFCLPSNDKFILSINFGCNWNIIQNDFHGAAYTKTEIECLVSAASVYA